MDLPAALTVALLVAEVAAVVLAVRTRVGWPLVLLLVFALLDELAELVRREHEAKIVELQRLAAAGMAIIRDIALPDGVVYLELSYD